MLDKILQQIQTNAEKTDRLIIDYLEHNIDVVNKDILSAFNYALEIISVYRERSFIVKTVGDYFKLSEDTLAPFMVSSELIILSAYIKDDIVDSTNIRAGKETVHKKYGVEYAILLSDILLSLANKLLIETTETNRLNYEIINKVNSAYIDLCVGQSIRIQDFNHITPEEVERIAFLKAGSIIGTFSCIPALIIQDYNLAKSFYEYGKWLGISLQFRNDFEDFSLNEENSDNPTFQDIRFNYPNILLAYLSEHYSNISATDKELINKFLGSYCKKEILLEDKSQLLKILERYNVIQDAYEHLERLSENSINSIKYIDTSFKKATLLELVKLVYHVE